MNNIHGPGSTATFSGPAALDLSGRTPPDFLLANDQWSQIISLRYGPDGSVFMIDWYDKNQCHHIDVNGHDRTNGRIFKVSFGDTKIALGDLQKLDSHSLVQMQTFSNEWHARHARRILQERGKSAEVNAMLQALAARAIGQPAIQLRILLAQAAVGGLSDGTEIERRLSDPEAVIRAWTIQLATEQGRPSARIRSRFAELARTDPSPVVRLYLASALQRLPLGNRWDIARGPGRPCRRRRRSQPAAHVLVRRGTAGRSRRIACREAGVWIKDSPHPGVHGASNRSDRDGRVDGASGRPSGPSGTVQLNALRS